MGRETPRGFSVCTAEEVMACELGDGLALLHRATGQFFLLDEVGSFIWKLLAIPATAHDVAEAVQRTYDAAPDEIERDVRDFVQHMVDTQLFEVKATVR